MKWWIAGAGGFARKASQAVMANGDEVCGFLDENPAAQSPVPGLPVVAPGMWPAAGPERAVFVAIGRGDVRQRLVGLLDAAGWSQPPLVHPRAWVAPDAQLGSGCFVGAMASVESCAVLGRSCLVDTGAVVDHDARVDDFVHVRPGEVVLSGVHRRRES